MGGLFHEFWSVWTRFPLCERGEYSGSLLILLLILVRLVGILLTFVAAGALVDDEDLREALKANGIGRPSTRAAIIEILYKRGYIVKERKSLRATPAAIELVALIKEELLKSAKLTGIWEGKLRQIEHEEYSAKDFIDQIKQMISEITISVLRDPTNRRIVAEQAQDKSEKESAEGKSTKKKEKKGKK